MNKPNNVMNIPFRAPEALEYLQIIALIMSNENPYYHTLSMRKYSEICCHFGIKLFFFCSKVKGREHLLVTKH